MLGWIGRSDWPDATGLREFARVTGRRSLGRAIVFGFGLIVSSLIAGFDDIADDADCVHRRQLLDAAPRDPLKAWSIASFSRLIAHWPVCRRCSPRSPRWSGRRTAVCRNASSAIRFQVSLRHYHPASGRYDLGIRPDSRGTHNFPMDPPGLNPGRAQRRRGGLRHRNPATGDWVPCLSCVRCTCPVSALTPVAELPVPLIARLPSRGCRNSWSRCSPPRNDATDGFSWSESRDASVGADRQTAEFRVDWVDRGGRRHIHRPGGFVLRNERSGSREPSLYNDVTESDAPRSSSYGDGGLGAMSGIA